MNNTLSLSLSLSLSLPLSLSLSLPLSLPPLPPSPPSLSLTASLEVQSVEYNTNNDSIIVTCITTGWPATQVKWSRNGNQLTPGNGLTMKQRVMDRELCTYKNDLIVQDALMGLGTYRCEVKSLRHNGFVIDTTVGSVTVQSAGSISVAVTTMGSLEVGESFTLNCTINKVSNQSLNIRWVKDNVTIASDVGSGVTLGATGEDAQSISKLLTLSPIRLSHSGQYSCDAMNGSVVDGRATIRVDIDSKYNTCFTCLLCFAVSLFENICEL